MNIEIAALLNVAPCFLVLCYQRYKEKCWRCGLHILPQFWYIVTNVSKENAEYAGSRLFQNSGTLLQNFQRKILKMKAADSSKILVHFYKCFGEKCWRYGQEILPKFWYVVTNVSKEIAEDISRIFFQNSSTLLQMFQRKYWRYKQDILPKFWYIATNVSNENAEDKSRRFFQNSGS